MNKKLIKCPACGSTKVTREEHQSSHQLTLGSKFFYKDISYKCLTCSEEGDFSSETDENFINAQKEAQIQFINKIIEEFGKSNISMAMVERVFELPARTLTRWKNGDFSSSGLALLRILKTYPWIIEVAENRFEPFFVSFALVRAAMQEFAQKAHQTFAVGKPETKSGVFSVGSTLKMYTASTKPEAIFTHDQDTVPSLQDTAPLLIESQTSNMVGR